MARFSLTALALVALLLIISCASRQLKAPSEPFVYIQVHKISDVEKEALKEINKYRRSKGARPLEVDTQLVVIADWQAEDMAGNNYFSHTDSLGRDPFVRMGEFGFTYNTWRGENLAAGVSDGKEAFELWRKSPGHNANMLNPNFTRIGISVVCHDDTTFECYWASELSGTP